MSAGANDTISKVVSKDSKKGMSGRCSSDGHLKCEVEEKWIFGTAGLVLGCYVDCSVSG